MSSNLNIGNKENYKPYNVPPEEKNLINNKLPIEVFEIILSHLDPKSKQQAAAVSRLWSEATVDTASHQEFSIIKDFAKHLSENLKGSDYAPQREALLNIGEGTKIFDSVNLVQIKSSIHDLKEKILDVLKDVKKEDLEKLKKIKISPPLLVDIFDLAYIYCSIEEEKKSADEAQKNEIFKDCSKLLMQTIIPPRVDKAIQVANMISDEVMKGEALFEISKELICIGHVDKAIEIAKGISDEKSKGNAFCHIVKDLTFRGKPEQGLQMANLIPKDLLYGATPIKMRDQVIVDLATDLWQLGNKDKAIEILRKVPKNLTKTALQKMYFDLVKVDNFSQAIDVVELMVDNEDRKSTFNYLFKETVSKGEIDTTGIKLIKVLMRLDHMDQAIELAKGVSGDKREMVFMEIFWALSYGGNQVKAMEVLGMMKQK